ncbi:MAG: hypothetical protein D6B28_00470 [Gammaproteobacteria bacterium]|nr:MAG: hypothetical protein D6B28_00470 [Gammaproteobacteria bacterium]
MKSVCVFRLLISLTALTSSHCFAIDILDLQPADFSKAKLIGDLKYNSLDEASGLTKSPSIKDLFWVINDGGDNPFIYAIDKSGKHLGRYFIKGVDNRDWEDISSYSKDGSNYLVIADTGDNKSIHRDSFLWIVKEPDLRTYKTKKLNTLSLFKRIRFRYEDGPRDCESIVVDEKNQRILLLSKRTVPAVMYQLPLNAPKKKRLLIATRIAELNTIPQPTTSFLFANPIYGKYASQPTAMDISPDGNSLAVLTYVYGYIYQLEENEKWETAVEKKPKVFQLPDLTQAEALCFDDHGNILVTSEKRPAPVYMLQKKSTGE